MMIFLVRITTGETNPYSVKHLMKGIYASNATNAAGFAGQASIFLEFFLQQHLTGYKSMLYL
jgi:hypothetical protein